MVLFTGQTVEEAIEKGLEELQLPRFKAHIKVISKEKKGFLGFGKKLAQVEVEGINEDTVYQADKNATKGVPEEINQQNAPVVKPVQSQSDDNEKEVRVIPETTVQDEIVPELIEELPTEETVVPLSSEKEKTEVVDLPGTLDIPEPIVVPEVTQDSVVNTEQDDSSFEDFVAKEFPNDRVSQDIEKATEDVAAYVTKIIYEMDIEATVDTSHNRRQINLQIDTQEAGRVIGYHGKVLKSLQLLAQNYLHDRYSKNFSVNVNVHDYVEHRTETLIDFTQKVANRVLESQEKYTMDPMSNSERKIVHKTVSTIEGVTSYSEGNDPNRYVVVSLQD